MINYSFCIWRARAMHLAPCVPARFVTGSIAAHLHPARSSTIISSNRGRKSTPPLLLPSPELSPFPMENHRSYDASIFSKDFDDDSLVCIPFLSSPISPRVVRKMAELGTRCTIEYSDIYIRIRAIISHIIERIAEESSPSSN